MVGAADETAETPSAGTGHPGCLWRVRRSVVPELLGPRRVGETAFDVLPGLEKGRDRRAVRIERNRCLFRLELTAAASAVRRSPGGGPLRVRIQSPERSGVPAAVFGGGASSTTLPSASRGSLGSVTGAHCAEAPAVQASAMRQGSATRNAVAPVCRCSDGRPQSAGVVFVLGTSILLKGRLYRAELARNDLLRFIRSRSPAVPQPLDPVRGGLRGPKTATRLRLATACRRRYATTSRHSRRRSRMDTSAFLPERASARRGSCTALSDTWDR